MRLLRRFLADRRGDEFAQTAIVTPLIVLLTLALFNMSIAGFASVNASNAANHGARIGSVNQRGVTAAAYSAAMQSISNAPVGDYVVNVSGGGFPGATIVVSVQWEVPNYMAPVMEFMGYDAPNLSGTSTATFRQEGW
jgi:Flp pilus assembly protein TadG